MKEIYNTLINILNRADFYYPMCDLGYSKARGEFESDRNRYFKLIEEQSLTEDEKEDFKNLWCAKQDYCNASMSMNSELEAETAKKYKALLSKYFETK